MPKKAPDTGTFSNAADDKTLEEIKRIEAAGGDPFGDNDDGDAPHALKAESQTDPTEDAEADDSPVDDTTKGDEKVDASKDEAAPNEAQAERGAAINAPTQEEEPVIRFDTMSREQLAQKEEALFAAKEKAFTDFDEGVIDRAAFQKLTRDFDKEMMGLASASALLQATEQQRLASQQAKLNAIKVEAKAQGFDYDLPGAADEFNAALQFVGSIQSNATLSFGALADKAHAMVLAQRGVQLAKPQASTTSPSPPPARKAPAAPITLSMLPSASTPNSNGGADEQLSRLHGQEFEAAIAAMPKAKRDAWMDS